MKIRGIIFDLDGTLADTIPLTVYSLQETARELAGKNLSYDEVIKEFGPIDTDIIKKLVDYKDPENASKMYVKHFMDHFESYVKPVEGIEELLKYLKSEGIRTGIFTGRSLEVTEIILEKLGIRRYFDSILAGNHTTSPKPHPEGILKSLEILKVSSEDSIYVGDFEADVLASKAAGTFSVLALWSSTGSDALKSLNPDMYFYKAAYFQRWVSGVLAGDI